MTIAEKGQQIWGGKISGEKKKPHTHNPQKTTPNPNNSHSGEGYKV